MSFKPMLAAPIRTEKGESLDDLRYPLLATPKIDGIRCLIIDGVAMSRSLKPIPNAYIQSVIGKPEFNGLDGELLVGTTFQDATSGIMSEDGEPDFRFYVFDRWDIPAPGYRDRVTSMLSKIAQIGETDSTRRIVPLVPVHLHSRADLDEHFLAALADGHEGIMLRSAGGTYKHGRATFKQGTLIKCKPFEDAEATVVGFEERMHNANEATTNALGRTERSSHKANLVPMGTLGALIVSSPKWAGTFNLGTGFTDALRAEIWANRDKWLGATVRFRYQAIGTKDLPRIPVFQGRRDEKDL